MMLSSLINSGRYMGIERTEAFLAEVDREHSTQRSGMVDDRQISALGRQFGVKYICVVDIAPAFGSFQLSARIIDTETAVVVFIGEAYVDHLNSVRELRQVSNEVVENMFRGQPAPRIAEATPPQPQVVGEPTPQIIDEPTPEISKPQIAEQVAEQIADEPTPQLITRQERERTPQDEGARLRLVFRLSTGALAAGGIIGGIILDNAANSEFDKYKATNDATEATNRRDNVESLTTIRNLSYILGGIGAAGLTLTFIF